MTIGNSVTSIGWDAFYECTGLKKSAYPSSIGNPFHNGVGVPYPADNSLIDEKGLIWSADKSALYFVPYTYEGSFEIPNSVTKFVWAFRECSGLTSVTIPNSVTNIFHDAFSNCSGLTSVTIPNSVTSIGYGAFAGCTGLTSVTIPNSVTSIGRETFYGCSGLTSVTIPESVTEIGKSAFSSCTSLTSVTIGNSVTSIGQEAFSDCSRLTSVTIPQLVTEIGEQAFKGCLNLCAINACPVTPPICGTDAFVGVDKESCILYVPVESVSKYKSAIQWKEFFNIEGSDLYIKAESVALNKSSLSLNVGATETLVATVAPENTTDKTVTWTSSDTSVATVDANGLVTAVAAGTATITATCGNVSATCDVTVTIPAGMGLNTDDAAQARYFDLNGREVAGDKLVPGLYIKVVNGQTQKVVVK